MSQFYKIISKDSSPVTLTEAKSYLRITTTDDDTLIQLIIDSCTEWGELYTGKDFRVINRDLYIDCFLDRITILSNEINIVNSIYYTINSTDTLLAPSIYYLKYNNIYSEILLSDGESYPSIDDKEQGIRINYSTQAPNDINNIKNILLKHIATTYENRGDCMDCGDVSNSGDVAKMYNIYRIPRI